MNCTWVLHTLAFTDDDRVQDMKQVILDRGSQLIECKGAFGHYELGSQLKDAEGPILAYGSCNFMKWVVSSTNWTHWCDWKKLECTSYMSYLAPHSIHMDYAYMPFGELIHNYRMLYRTYGDQKEYTKSCMFIRPNSNAKPFHGQVVHYANFEKWHDEHRTAWDIHDDCLCLISMPDSIEREWRIWVYGDKVLTGSLYRPEWQCNIPEAVRIFVEKAITETKFAPFPLFCMDIALTSSGHLGIIEYGSVNCAGLYSADVSKIVETMEYEAVQEWYEAND